MFTKLTKVMLPCIMYTRCYIQLIPNHATTNCKPIVQLIVRCYMLIDVKQDA